MEIVQLETQGEVTTVRLHRPDVRNAMDEGLISELTRVFGTLPASTRVVVLAGSGPAFCAGADAQWMKRSRSFTREENERDAAALAALLKAIDECPYPTVARVHGAALGGGVGLVAACDIAVADDQATFGFPEVRLGLVPAVISTFVLPRIGIRAARRYFLTGERFGAAQAAAMGLVHETAPGDALDGRTDGIVRELCQGAPRALGAAKALLRTIPTLSKDRAIEESIRTIAELRVAPEAQEGLSAFLEKRKPNWP
jgi:methylglutaconyl-CoA hydratase